MGQVPFLELFFMKRPRKNKRIKGIVSEDGKSIMLKASLSDLIPEKPPPQKKPTPLQQGNLDRFSFASHFAAEQMENPASKAEYAARITTNKHTAYLVALADYLNPPKIIYIKADKYSGKIGDVILVKAIDDFKVVEVKVEILVDGKLIEYGKALPYPRKPKLWRYFATVENPNLPATIIRAKALDKPGNRAVMECVMSSLLA
jgi:hypothetical protein